VIDYTQDDFTRGGTRYDLILDVVANRPLGALLGALTPGGRYVAVAFSASALILGPLVSLATGKRVTQLSHEPSVEDLIFMTELVEAGKVVAVIDRCYPLSDVPEALRYYAQGHPAGKVVITMEHSSET
jgi:NADPH:quinone reductase-like Zn-dependent oxidoreductase